jgi:hypothetical protein
LNNVRINGKRNSSFVLQNECNTEFNLKTLKKQNDVRESVIRFINNLKKQINNKFFEEKYEHIFKKKAKSAVFGSNYNHIVDTIYFITQAKTSNFDVKTIPWDFISLKIIAYCVKLKQKIIRIREEKHSQLIKQKYKQLYINNNFKTKNKKYNSKWLSIIEKIIKNNLNSISNPGYYNAIGLQYKDNSCNSNNYFFNFINKLKFDIICSTEKADILNKLIYN